MNKISCAELDFRSMLNALIEEVRSVKDSVSNSKAVYTNKEMRELLDAIKQEVGNVQNS
jgi:hypothetical protein